MKEDLDLFVDLIHDVCPKEKVSCKGLVVFALKAINVTRPCHHCSRGVTFRSEVISGQPHGVSGAVAKLLGFGDRVDALIQKLA